MLVPPKKQCKVGKFDLVHISLSLVSAFLKQLLNGSKHQLKLAEVIPVNVPNYPEVRLISTLTFSL